MSSSSIYIEQISPEHVTWDASLSPQEIMTERTGVGFAFLKTAAHLDLSITPRAEYDDSDTPVWHIEGSVAGIIDRADNLQKHIGLIARYSSQVQEYGFGKEHFGRTLGKLVQESIPGFTEETMFSQAIGALSYRFADYTNDDGVRLYIDTDLKPYHRMTYEERVDQFEATLKRMRDEREGRKLTVDDAIEAARASETLFVDNLDYGPFD